jgi:hypothetical protein
MLYSAFDRQERISGWNQQAITDDRAAVVGRSWLGLFTCFGLRALGIGKIIWFGKPRADTQNFARVLLDPSSSTGTLLFEAPCNIELGPELGWFLKGHDPSRIIIASDDPREARVTRDFANRNHIPCHAAGTAPSGWIAPADSAASKLTTKDQSPIISLILAALLVDAIRQSLVPLSRGMAHASGSLKLPLFKEWLLPSTQILLVGAGGIGSWLALVLAAVSQAGQLNLHIMDHDVCSPSNLNRQILFTPQDASSGLPKAEALARTLSGMCPHGKITASKRAFDPSSQTLASDPPALLLSAVDNARTRLSLSHFAKRHRIPLIHGGTAELAADCFLQSPFSKVLDVQMHGALHAAEQREIIQERRLNACPEPSYVVPSMMAAGLMAYRLARGIHDPNPQPICWRSGDLPIEIDTNHPSRVVHDTYADLRRFVLRSRNPF